MRHKSPKNLITVFLCLCLAACIFAPLRANADGLWPVGPVITADGAIVIEADTGAVLYKSNAYEAYQPANLSQIMTALLVLERAELNDIMTMSTKAETSTKGSRVGLVRKESVTVESALYAVLLASGNEVCYGLSEMISGDHDKFVELMNARALELGCTNTHFTTAWGADADDHYTCAADIAIIAREAYSHNAFMNITSSAKYTIPATNLKESRALTNRHLFIKGDIKYAQAVAGKVGYSSVAGYTGMTYVSKDGMNLICVILGGKSKEALYDETKQLCNWCFDNYTAYDIAENELGTDATFSALFEDARRFSTGESEAIIKFDGCNLVVVPKDVSYDEITRTVTFKQPEEYFHGDNLVGTVTYEYGGVYVGNANIIYYNEGYPLNSEVVDELWPDFLFKIDEVFTEEHAALLKEYMAMGNISPTPEPTQALTDAPTPTMTEQQQNYEAISGFRRKLIIGSGIAVAVVLIALYMVAFEIPYLKKRME